MENAILITNASTSLDTIATVSTLDFLKESDNVLHYSTSTHFLSVVYSNAGAAEYEEEELAFIISRINNPVFFTLDTNSFDLLKKFVAALPNTLDFLIDNDFGSIVDKQEFIALNSFEEFFSYSIVKSD